jgi:hypothetical protein
VRLTPTETATASSRLAPMRRVERVSRSRRAYAAWRRLMWCWSRTCTIASASRARRAANKLDELADRCEKVAEQIDPRVRGLKVTDRLVSITDPDARPIRKGLRDDR